MRDVRPGGTLALMLQFAQTPVLPIPNGGELMIWLGCAFLLLGMGVTILGAIVLWKQAFSYPPSLREEFSGLNGRVTTIEQSIKSLATQKELAELEKAVGITVERKFTELDNKRATDVRNLHSHLETANVRVAQLQISLDGVASCQAHTNLKLDRWLEGELAESRRELLNAKTVAAA